MLRVNRRDPACLFRATCHARKRGAAIMMPVINPEATTEHLVEVSIQATYGVRAAVVRDAAVGTGRAGDCVSPRTSRCCHGRPTRPNSIRWRASGATCAATGSVGVSGIATRQSSSPARTPRCSWSAILMASTETHIDPGHWSNFGSAPTGRRPDAAPARPHQGHRTPGRERVGRPPALLGMRHGHARRDPASAFGTEAHD